jgi:hypothetical protein
MCTKIFKGISRLYGVLRLLYSGITAASEGTSSERPEGKTAEFMGVVF